MIECNESTCSIGSDCTNRRLTNFQPKRVIETVEISEVPGRGYGLVSKAKLPCNTIVIEYIGELITESEKQNRWAKYQSENLHYVMSLTGGFYIDATLKGNWARFVNHSCKPNCIVKRIIVDRKPRIVFITVTEISVEDQITIAYDFDPSENPQGCLCGEGLDNCLGIIGLKPKTVKKRKRSDEMSEV
ncbi:hypothetical protein BKA56DRAFT_477115 [Ilyonectria sp. MPI-CAGE-AT-0026]|nr:hypothetical protein BKA56DRAFT_477115 [Ilyonectria sp. MPI-CAGE-AT-0026]